MGIKSRLGRWMKVELLGAAAVVLVACATGVDPVRPGGTGGDPSGGSTGEPVGPSTSDSSGDFTSSTTDTSSAASTSASSTTASSSGAASSSSSAASSSAASSSAAATSASSSSGGVMGLELQYLCADVNAANNQLKPHFNVINGGSSSVPLSSLTIRYYFTAEGNPPLIFECDYAKVGCGNLAGVFASTAGANADHYLEVSFTAGAGTLAPGAQSGEVQARFHNQDYSNINQANDYSFDPTKTAFTDWDKITLYQGGVLVWGTEP